MIERVFVVPLNYSHRQSGLIHAFDEIFGYSNVHSAFDYMAMHRRGMTSNQINGSLFDSVRKFRPDWIWMQLQTSDIVTSEVVENIKQVLPQTIVTHWMGDLRTEVPDHLARICKATDATLLSNRGQFQLYQAAGAKRVHYTQIGLDWDEDVLGLSWNGDKTNREVWEPPFRVPEVVFCGGYYEHMPGHKLRLAAIRRLLEEKIDVGVVSESPWPSDIPVVGSCHVKQQHAVYRRAKVVLSINNYNDIENYFSDRQLIAMASGTPVVARWVPGLDDLEYGFRTHECSMFGSYLDDSLDSMVKRVKRLLANEELRQSIGMAGRMRVMRDHSWHTRILDLLPVVESWRAQL
jgi:hypothetical protein